MKPNDHGAAAINTALRVGMQAQLAVWRHSVLAHGNRLGWKIGFGEPAAQRRAGLVAPVIGFLRRDRLLQSGSEFRIPKNSVMKAEVEVAIRMGRDVAAGISLAQAEDAIAAIALGVEIVDVTEPLVGIESLLRGNLYHAAVLIGPEQTAIPTVPRESLQAHLHVNGAPWRDSEPQRLPERFGEIVQVVAHTLSTHGEHLATHDWIICGAIIESLAVKGGDRIDVQMPPCERIALSFTE